MYADQVASHAHDRHLGSGHLLASILRRRNVLTSAIRAFNMEPVWFDEAACHFESVAGGPPLSADNRVTLEVGSLLADAADHAALRGLDQFGIEDVVAGIVRDPDLTASRVLSHRSGVLSDSLWHALSFAALRGCELCLRFPAAYVPLRQELELRGQVKPGRPVSPYHGLEGRILCRVHLDVHTTMFRSRDTIGIFGLVMSMTPSLTNPLGPIPKIAGMALSERPRRNLALEYEWLAAPATPPPPQVSQSPPGTNRQV